MKQVLVLGAGLVTKPMIDYYLDTCGYEVVLASRTVSAAVPQLSNRAGTSPGSESRNPTSTTKP